MFEEILVDEETRTQRMEICKPCERLTWALTCDVCNCFMPAKTKLAGAECPEGKWPAVIKNDTV